MKGILPSMRRAQVEQTTKCHGRNVTQNKASVVAGIERHSMKSDNKKNQKPHPLFIILLFVLLCRHCHGIQTKQYLAVSSHKKKKFSSLVTQKQDSQSRHKEKRK